MNVFFISAIFSLVIFIIFVMSFAGKKKKVRQREIPLSEIAELWAKSQRSGQLHIKDIAPLWCKSAIKEEERSEYHFRSTEVQEWFSNNITQQPWFNQAEAHKEICYQLLRMLEDEGDCSSVVNPSNDVEASWDTNTYSMLGRTTLLDHSIHVAEHAIILLTAADAQHVIPDAMVAALAHDLGKLPSNRTHLYSLGEHPLAAGRVLAEITLFKGLSHKEDIARAIKQHHMRPEGLIGKTLKKADQQARQQELELAVERYDSDQTGETAQEVGTETSLRTFHPPSDTKTAAGSARKADADIYGDETIPPKSGKAAPQALNISSWFDTQTFIDQLNPYINRLEGRRFMAFSMPTGHVFFQARVIEEVARMLAERAGAMDIATMAEKDKTMQQVLFSVVAQFRQHDLIARDLIRDQYFGGYFNVRMQSGKVLKGYYTPFKAEAFGSIAEMENSKKGILKSVAAVEVYHD